MSNIGFPEVVTQSILRLVAVILAVGEVDFLSNPAGDAIVSDPSVRRQCTSGYTCCVPAALVD